MTSSTSSSNASAILDQEVQAAGEELRARGPRRTKRSGKRVYNLGLIGLIVLIISLEMLVFRNVMFYGYSPGCVGRLAELKVCFEQADPEQIEVAIFGDSMSMDALRPDQMEAAAGMEPGSIFNFSISGGSAFDVAKTYEAYIDQLSGLQKVIVVVNEHQFNDHLMYTADGKIEDVKFKFYANLQDRLAVMNWDNYGDMALGWLLKSYDMRSVWVMMLEKYRNGTLREAIPVHSGGLPAVTYAEPDSKTLGYARNVADRWFEDYGVEGIRADYFENMMKDLSDRDVEVFMLQLPRSPLFEQVIREDYANESRLYHQFIEDTARRYGAELQVMSNDALDVDAHFRDSNHVNAKGAEWVSRVVGEQWLRR